MLIHSDRHTAADVAKWTELEKADKAHSHSPTLWRNYRRCCELARAFLEDGPAWCGVSWGKDSVLLAHMVLSIDKTIPLRWIKVEPVFNPDCHLVRDYFFRFHRKCDYNEVITHISEKRESERTSERGAKIIASDLGERRLSGVRAAESPTRKMRFWKHGVNTKLTSAPLSYLTEKDVFALLYAFDLPVHPAYGCLGGGRWDRSHLRVSSLGGDRGNGHGRLQWEQEYYGEELRRIQSR